MWSSRTWPKEGPWLLLILHLYSSGLLARPCEKWSSYHLSVSPCLVFKPLQKYPPASWVSSCLTVFTSHSTLWEIVAPTLFFHTGQVAYNQCVGAFLSWKLLSWEQLPTVFTRGGGFQWEPVGLNQTGWWTKTISWMRLETADWANHFLRPAQHFLDESFDLVLTQKMIPNGNSICRQSSYFVFPVLFFKSDDMHPGFFNLYFYIYNMSFPLLAQQLSNHHNIKICVFCILLPSWNQSEVEWKPLKGCRSS